MCQALYAELLAVEPSIGPGRDLFVPVRINQITHGNHQSKETRHRREGR